MPRPRIALRFYRTLRQWQEAENIAHGAGYERCEWRRENIAGLWGFVVIFKRMANHYGQAAVSVKVAVAKVEAQVEAPETRDPAAATRARQLVEAVCSGKVIPIESAESRSEDQARSIREDRSGGLPGERLQEGGDEGPEMRVSRGAAGEVPPEPASTQGA